MEGEEGRIQISSSSSVEGTDEKNESHGSYGVPSLEFLIHLSARLVLS